MRYPERKWSLTGVALLLSLALVGCGAPQQVADHDPGIVAFRFLPNVGATAHHPDDLRALSLSADRSALTFETSFGSVLAKWSVRPRYKDAPSHSHRPFLSFRGGTPAQITRFATSERDEAPFAMLGSKEVTLAQLASSHNLHTLSSEKRQELINSQLNSYEDTLRVDVYFRRLPLSALRSMDASLQDGQARTYPLVARSYKLGYAVDRGQRLTYRRMSLYFDRQVDGKDLLDEARRLRLTVISAGERWKFDWKWNEAPSSSPAAPADR